MNKQNEQGYIELEGVHVNNLDIDSLRIPRGELVVLSGLSGSGKSSLAFDTLYAEGHRRYVQSLSSYARQFLDRLPKPDARRIAGIPPAIVIEQRVSNRNPRSTVGTMSEIYEYLCLLYARVGRIISPTTGQEIVCHTTKDVTDFILSQAGKRIVVLAPIEVPDVEALGVQLDIYKMDGYTRVFAKGKMAEISTPDVVKAFLEGEKIYLMVDRFEVTDSSEFLARCGDSVEAAFREGNNACRIAVLQEDGAFVYKDFSARLEADGIEFKQPTPALFNFNNPQGACPECAGYGKVIGIDEDLIIPNRLLSVYSGAVFCWRGNSLQACLNDFIKHAAKYDFPIHTPYYQLTEEQKDLLWNGDGDKLDGINQFFQYLEEHKHKIQVRIMLARFKGKATCPVCHGKRLRKEATWVKIGGKAITQLVDLPLTELADFINTLKFDEHDAQISKRILTELKTRIGYLLDVGVGYLTLNRLASTLSGGETQRINLATSLGSSLVGSLYILDEPSIGLHSVDTERLLEVLRGMRDQGNTVLVVEHDLDIIRAADTIIDLGPRAGSLGGKVVYEGDVKGIEKCEESLTGGFLSGRLKLKARKIRSNTGNYILLENVIVNNLQNLTLKLPLGLLTVITGVSGSGKSSLVREALIPALQSLVDASRPAIANFSKISYEYDDNGEHYKKTIEAVEFVDQDPLSRSLRSTPVTYIKAYDDIRELFAKQTLAKNMGYSKAMFSFNAPGGRCENCEGMGVQIVGMQFMADVEVKCEKCHGTRFQDAILEVKYRGKSIYDVLEMTVEEALRFFKDDEESSEAKRIIKRLQVLYDVGLDYVKLGIGTSELSGGEAQRLKLSLYLADPMSFPPTFFAFDEPTTGLHIADIDRLLQVLDSLLKYGHTVVLIEHNLDVIRKADWIIDMGPGAGKDGGRIVAEGAPADIAKNPESVTGRYL